MIITTSIYGTFYDAIRNNDIELVKEYIKKGADLDKVLKAEYSYNGTPLDLALYYEHRNITKLLLDNNLDLYKKDHHGLIHWRIPYGLMDIRGHKYLIELGYQPPDDYKLSKLMIAVIQSDYNKVKSLIKKGADINEKDNWSCTALFYALKDKNIKIVKLLISSGAKINIVNKSKKTPLIIALENGASKVSMLLINKGANIHYSNFYGNTILAASEGNLPNLCKFLINNKVKAHKYYTINESLFTGALDGNSIDVLKFILNKNSKTDNKKISSYLYYCLRKDPVEAVNILLKSGLKVDDKDRNGSTLLIDSVTQNAYKVFDLLIKKDVNLNLQDNRGDTAFHHAIQLNNRVFIKALLKKDVKLDIKNSNGMTPLHLAIEYKKFDLFKNIIKIKKINLNKKIYGSLLTEAVKNKNIEIIKYLIKSGVNINGVNQNGATALMEAAKSGGDFKIFKYLLKKGARLEITDNNGDNAIHYLYRDGYDIKNFPLDKVSSKYDVKNKKGETPLLLLIKNRLFKENFKMSKIKKLYKIGFDIHTADNKGNNLIFYAISQNNFELFKYLIDKKVNINKVNSEGISILMHATDKAVEEYAIYLLKKGALIDGLFKNKDSLLIRAIKNKKTELAKLLVNKGANLDYKNLANRTALMYAANNNDSHLFQLLIYFGAHHDDLDSGGDDFKAYINNNSEVDRLLTFRKNNQPIEKWIEFNNFLIASAFGDLKYIKKYLINNDINQKDYKGDNALNYAIKNNQIKIIKYLIKNKIKINNQNSDNISPLIYAIINHRDEILNILIDNNADLTITNEDGLDPLMFAIIHNNKEAINILKNKNIDLNKIDNNGRTYLMFALKMGNEKLALELIKRGAKLDIVDKYGLNLGCYAAMGDCVNILEKFAQMELSIYSKCNYKKDLLYYAVMNESYETLDWLVKNSFNINQTYAQEYSDSATVLDFVIESKNRKMINILLDYNAKRKNGSNRLMYAAEKDDYDLFVKYHNLGDNLYATDDKGSLVINYAILGKSKSIVKYILKSGFDVNTIDKHKTTPLHYSVTTSHYGITKLLLDNGANPNLGKGSLLVMAGLKNDNSNISKLLLEKGLDINKEYEGMTPLISAISQNNINMVRFILKNGAKFNNKLINPFIAAAKLKSIDIYCELLKYAKDENIYSIYGQTPFEVTLDNIKKDSYYISSEDKEFMNFIIGDLNKQELDKAISYCLKKEHNNGIKIFTDHYKKLDYKDEMGNNLLILAAKYDHIDIVDKLIESGLNLNIVNEKKQSALMVAAMNNNHEIARKIIDAGANSFIIDNLGKDVIDYAIYSDSGTTIEILLKKYREKFKNKRKLNNILIKAKKYKATSIEIIIKDHIRRNL